MTHISHVLLSTISRPELAITRKAQFTELNPLSYVRKHAFEVDEALDVEDVEVVSPAHVVEVFLHAVALQVAEQADAK